MNRSVRYVDYVKSINNLYNLGYINEMQITQEEFESLSVAEQNKRLKAVKQFLPEDEYILINKDKGIKAHKSVVKSFQIQRQKLMNSFPSLSSTGINGKPLIDLIPMFNLAFLKPTDNTEWTKSTPEYAVKLIRDGLISNLEKIKAEPLIIQSTITENLINEVSKETARLQNEYQKLIVYVSSMNSNELLSMVAKTRGLELAMEPIILYFDKIQTEEQKKNILIDNVQERIDFLNSISMHRWV